VHLGSDLNDHPQPAGFGLRSKRVDEDLARLLDHYAATPPAPPASAPGARWRIVFAGDFIDFIGMAILPNASQGGRGSASDDPLATEPSAEEREHGLGNAEDHARAKLCKVATRHSAVFAALSRFVAKGHALTIVHGNHDVEFHWQAVRDALRAILVGHAVAQSELDGDASRTPFDASAFEARIDFNPWFFYADGVAYIEHGHQYDALCASEHVMAPESAIDPRRIARGFSDVLLRFVVRPTRGLKEHGHERMGIADYLLFGARLGFKGLFKLGSSFARAIVELMRVHRASISDAAKRLREEHERRIAAFASQGRFDLDRLRQLVALQTPPITHSIRGILASVLLDRLLVALLSIAALVVAVVFGIKHGWPAWLSGAGVVVGWYLVHRHLAKSRKLDPDEMLVDRAGRLAKLFPAAFVVMGHTHTPVEVTVAEGASTYINVGSWSEQEDDSLKEHGYRAARTHLVIHSAESGPVAEFLAWDSSEGPRRFVSRNST
jgi:UDP-2,3-diacylglucosamine pyrophosphatase LpxH